MIKQFVQTIQCFDCFQTAHHDPADWRLLLLVRLKLQCRSCTLEGASLRICCNHTIHHLLRTSVLVCYCCIINYHTHNGLQDTQVLSHNFRECGVWVLSSSSHKVTVRASGASLPSEVLSREEPTSEMV